MKVSHYVYMFTKINHTINEDFACFILVNGWQKIINASGDNKVLVAAIKF